MHQGSFSIRSTSCLAKLALAQLLMPECLVCRSACNASNFDLCPACERQLGFDAPQCRQCALPLASPTRTGHTLLCGDCQLHPKPFNHVFAASIYNNVTSHLIYRYKEGHQWQAARALSHLLCRRLNQQLDYLANTVLVPVPCHPSRLRERGFAQATEISHYLSKRLGLRQQALLTKNNQGPPQKSLNREQRLKNLSNTFSANSKAPIHCLLIDDVLTTGATAIAASKALLNAGAERVDIAVLARTPLKTH